MSPDFRSTVPATPLTPASSESVRLASAPGSATLGQYELLQPLGKGGMGQVYRALHVRLKREVAVKVLHAIVNISPRQRQRFFVEMEALGRLEHPHIVRATDAGECEGRPFLVMELLDGADLSRCVQARGPWSPADACLAIQQAALGLQYAHERGVVHRDIKPSNLFLTREGVVKILDLGLARCCDAAGSELTGSHEIMGTYDYMAPEQGGGSHNADIRADLYSLGCTLFYLLTGRPPFAHLNLTTWQDKIEAHRLTPPPVLRELRADAPAELEAVLGRMLAKRPEDRYQTPSAAAEAVAPWARMGNLRDEPSLSMASLSGPTPVDSYAGMPEVAGWRAGLPASSRTPLLTDEKPSRRRMFVGIVAAVAATVAAGLIIATSIILWNGSGGPPKVVTKDPGLPPEHKPRLAAPGQWHTLLDQDPVVLRSAPGFTRWHRDAKKQELLFDTGELCLLKLGETTAQDFDLEMVFELTRPGSVGVFVGEQPDPAAPPQRQLVLVQLQPPNTLEATLMLMQPQPPYASAVDALAQASLKPQNLSRFTLAVEVRQGRFKDVLLNGTSHKHWAELVKESLVGSFGVLSQRGAATVTSARYRWHRPED